MCWAWNILSICRKPQFYRKKGTLLFHNISYSISPQLIVDVIYIPSYKEEQSGGIVDWPFMICTLNVM